MKTNIWILYGKKKFRFYHNQNNLYISIDYTNII